MQVLLIQHKNPSRKYQYLDHILYPNRYVQQFQTQNFLFLRSWHVSIHTLSLSNLSPRSPQL